MIITFLSDFGTEDGYVGAVKGRIKSINPALDIIDISHAIPAFDIKKASYAILNYYGQFPVNSVHLCVVDPGVGSERKGLILEVNQRYLVGPDNGIFDLLMKYEQTKVYQINFSPENGLSETFHGRDIFAPVAAYLAQEGRASAFGTPISTNEVIRQEYFIQDENTIRASILTADHFGNLIFGIRKMDLAQKRILKITFKGVDFKLIHQYYEQGTKDRPLCLWNSMNFMEIAIQQASALNYFYPLQNSDELIINMENL